MNTDYKTFAGHRIARKDAVIIEKGPGRVLNMHVTRTLSDSWVGEEVSLIPGIEKATISSRYCLRIQVGRCFDIDAVSKLLREWYLEG